MAFLFRPGAGTPLFAQEISIADAAGQKQEAFDKDFDETEEPEVTVPDPIEPINRGIFFVNDKLYFYLLKPVARAFRSVPEPGRVSISNFFSNLYTPARLVNATLQFKFKDAGTELLRFVMNTTIGVAGLFDPAKTLAGLNKKEEDFGQTLGVLGIGPGFYIVLPLLGPANVRDGIGQAVDAFLDPVSYVGSIGAYTAVKALGAVNATSLDHDTYEGIKRQAIDPYLFIRNAYTQKRETQIAK